jgi:hypothetical protein
VSNPNLFGPRLETLQVAKVAFVFDKGFPFKEDVETDFTD